MPEQYTYLLVDFFYIIFPLIFSFVPRFRFYTEWKFFAPPCLATGTIFIVWDIIFTRIAVWGFNPHYVIGVYKFGLPLEEYLFFLCVPYACIFTYHCITLFFSFNAGPRGPIFTKILSACLLVVGALHLQQLYTSVTFIGLAVFLFWLSILRIRFLTSFFVSFALILLPFFIANGILTGSIINRTVVWYNNQYNLGIRMFTIPVEDTFYGMLLLLMNIAGFNWLKTRQVKQVY